MIQIILIQPQTLRLCILSSPHWTHNLLFFQKQKKSNIYAVNAWTVKIKHKEVSSSSDLMCSAAYFWGIYQTADSRKITGNEEKRLAVKHAVVRLRPGSRSTLNSYTTRPHTLYYCLWRFSVSPAKVNFHTHCIAVLSGETQNARTTSWKRKGFSC